MNFKNILLASLIISLSLLTACGDKITEEIYYGSTEIISEQIPVEKDKWWWSEQYERYEATFDVDHINEDVFEKGEVNVSLFIEEEQMVDGKLTKYEVLKFLPFSRVFYEYRKDESGKVVDTKIYTEQFGFDYQIGKITFYIEYSDKQPRPNELRKYTFKVSSILDDRNFE